MPHSKESRPDGCKKLSAVIHIVVVHRVIQLSHSYISFYISRHKRSGSAAFGLSAQWPCWAPSAGSALKKPCSRPGQVISPLLSFSPVEWEVGTRPIYPASLSELAKRRMSSSSARKAKAVIMPMPGTERSSP